MHPEKMRAQAAPNKASAAGVAYRFILVEGCRGERRERRFDFQHFPERAALELTRGELYLV
jgi:hypothetical protein